MSDGMEQSAVNRSAVFEADFDLRRMDVDIYGFWIDSTYWKIYGICFVVYLLFVMVSTNRRDNHKRRILTLSTWSCK